MALLARLLASTAASAIFKITSDDFVDPACGTSDGTPGLRLRQGSPCPAVVRVTPIGLAVEGPFVLITRKDLPASNLQDFISFAKENQRKMQFGSGGAGSGGILPVRYSIRSSVPTSRTFPIAAEGRRCKTSKAAG